MLTRARRPRPYHHWQFGECQDGVDVIGHHRISIDTDRIKVKFNFFKRRNDEIAEPIQHHLFLGNRSEQMPFVQSANCYEVKIAL